MIVWLVGWLREESENDVLLCFLTADSPCLQILHMSSFTLLSAMLATNELFSFNSGDDLTRSAWLPTMMTCDDPWAELQAFSMKLIQ